MSRVVIQGDASGTGDFTIAAPNSNTDRTLTLPDEAGEVLVTDGTTLVVDNTNNRVGIGTSSPTQALDLESSTGGRVAFTDTGTRRWSIGNNATSLTFVDESGSSEKMRIDASGRVTMPNQPAFNAGRTTGNVYNAVVIWDSVNTNVGGHYNATSGVFTAPVAGSYFFIANAICGSSGTSANSGSLQLRVNGSTIKDAHWNMSDPWENVSAPAVVTLNANDFVDVYVAGNFMYGTGAYSQFNGYLIG